MKLDRDRKLTPEEEILAKRLRDESLQFCHKLKELMNAELKGCVDKKEKITTTVSGLQYFIAVHLTIVCEKLDIDPNEFLNDIFVPRIQELLTQCLSVGGYK